MIAISVPLMYYLTVVLKQKKRLKGKLKICTAFYVLYYRGEEPYFAFKGSLVNWQSELLKRSINLPCYFTFENLVVDKVAG